MKKKVYYLIAFFMLLFVPMTVLGKGLTLGVDVSEKNVTRGDTVEVSINIKGSTEDDVSVFKTVISFDESLFEGIVESSFKAHNGWFDCTYNKETHALIVINKFGSRLNQEVVTFDLKVKDKVKPKTTSITLKDTVVANKDEEISINDASGKVNLNVPSNELDESIVSKEYYGKTLEGSTVRLYNILVIIILELIIATVLVMLYYASKLYVKDSKHRKMIVAGLCIVEIFAVAAMVGYDVDRGELTGDGNLDFHDVEALREHLVNLEMLSPLKLANADMNKDGKLTCLDLAILLDKTMEKNEYMVILTDSLMESNGYEKGSVFDLRFLADITDDLRIDYVLIDGKKYKATKVLNSPNEYTVKIEASKESKKYNYNLTEVILETGKSIKVDYKTQVMILKDVPKLSGFATNYNKEESKVNIALTLEDGDNAVVEAKYELVKSNGQVVESGTIEKGKNTFTFALENAKAYKFKIKANYNRGADSGEYLGVINDSYDIKIVTDYRLQVGNPQLVQNGNVVENLLKGVETSFTFSSTNVSGYVPRKAMINGVYYSVTSLGGNKYSVKVPNDVIRSVNSLTLSKIILSNGKTLLTNLKTSYNILKDVPSITNLTAIEDISNDKIAMNVSVKDDDKALNKLTVRVFDTNNSLISEANISDENYEIMLDASKNTDKYVIRVFGEYQLLDGNDAYRYDEVLLYEKKVDALQRVDVKDVRVDKIYPEKNEIIKMTYDVTSNYNSNLSKIVVNNVIYDVRKVAVGGYELEVNANATAGIQELKISKMIFENDFEYNLDKVLKVDVLKDKPTVDNFEIIENKQESKIDVTFDLFDEDNAFESGKLRLIEKETGEVKKEENVILGKNTSTFSLENAVKYDVQVVIDATLDTNSLEEISPNVLKDFEIKKVEARLITDYKLDITNIDTYQKGSDVLTNAFHRGEQIDVVFSSTNVTEYVPAKVKIDGKTYDVTTEEGISRFTLDGVDEIGTQNIKFESIVLSNHVELVLNSIKKIEIIKDVPVVHDLSIENKENSFEVRFELEDQDAVLSRIKAVVLDETGVELFSQELPKESRLFTFEQSSKKIFTIKILADYSLGNNAQDAGKFEYEDSVLFEKMIDLDKEYDTVDNLVDNFLVYDITEEEVMNITLEDLEDLELYRLKIQYLDDSYKLFEIEKFKRIEDTVLFILKTEDWIKSGHGKWQTDLTIEYGRVDESGLIHKN